jgi:hypothetical protein
MLIARLMQIEYLRLDRTSNILVSRSHLQVTHSHPGVHILRIANTPVHRSHLGVHCLYEAFYISKRERKPLATIPVIWVRWNMVRHEHS